MPCYDSRNDPSYVREEAISAARKSFLHNSPVAELLCFTLKRLSDQTRHHILMDNPKLGHWWRDHQERDKSKAQKEREYKAAHNKKTLKQISDLQTQLKK